MADKAKKDDLKAKAAEKAAEAEVEKKEAQEAAEAAKEAQKVAEKEAEEAKEAIEAAEEAAEEAADAAEELKEAEAEAAKEVEVIEPETVVGEPVNTLAEAEAIATEQAPEVDLSEQEKIAILIRSKMKKHMKLDKITMIGNKWVSRLTRREWIPVSVMMEIIEELKNED